MNPYWGKGFFAFFRLFWERLLSGEAFTSPVSDELQLFALFGISIAGSLVGTFLVLRRMTMLANSLSHTMILGIIAIFLITGNFSLNLGSLLIAAFVTALLTALLTHTLSHTAKLQEDASIGLVFTSLFAVGIVLITLFTRDAHVGTEVVLGNLEILESNDLFLIGVSATIDIILFFLFYKEFKLSTFDPLLATTMGISRTVFGSLLMILTSITVVAAFRAVGVLLVLAFLVAPPLIGRLWTHRLLPLLFLSAAAGILCSLLGVALSRHFLSTHHLPLSTAGIVVTLLGLLFALSALTLSPRNSLIYRRKWKA
ncbi:MAG: metal ABC transporter permease [Verrucomicrobia bacterium]|nr:metal ABC transporter permease [Verrucomicrobiota bacterium]